MKKVALINPGKNRDYGIHEPINLGYIAANLEKNGVEVKIIDQLSGADVEKEIVSFRPEVVGVTGTTPVISDAYAIADYARNKGILTVIGGVHVSCLPEEGLKHADIVIAGEGEQAMVDIAAGKIEKGIARPPYIKNIDDLPPPARRLMNMEYYSATKDRIYGTHLYYVPPKTRVFALLTSRGCPFKCIFCYNSWRVSPVRYHSPERVIQEIRELVEKYNAQALFFFDDEFFANKKRLKEICRLWKEQGFKLIWGCQARADTIDDENLQLVKEISCRQVNIGIESGSQKILDVLKRKTVTVEQNREAVEKCSRAGLICWGTFMIGNPGETLEDIKQTRKFIRESKLTAAMIHITTPYPGTRLWDWCKEKKLVPENVDWAKFTTADVCVSASDTLSTKEIEKNRIKILVMDIILSGKFDWKGLIWTLVHHPMEQFSTIKRILKAVFAK
jgi:radical SAM superfamily enzyme YgiQ (UPF0313 family)